MAAETTVTPTIKTAMLIVSHSGPMMERRYWHTVSSQAQWKHLRRLWVVRQSSVRQVSSPSALPSAVAVSLLTISSDPASGTAEEKEPLLGVAASRVDIKRLPCGP